MEQYFEMLSKVISKKRRWITIPTKIGWILMVISLAQFAYIKFGFMDKEVARYLVKTIFFNFSSKEFLTLCQKASYSLNHTNFLVYIYFSFLVFSVLGVLSIYFAYFVGKRIFITAVPRQEFLAYRTMLLEEYVGTQLSGLSPKIKAKSEKLIIRMNVFSVISPLKNNWQKRNIYSWIKNHLELAGTYKLLLALDSFEARALVCVRVNHELEKLKTAIHELASFLFLVKKAQIRNSHDSSVVDQALSYEHLQKFADIMFTIQPDLGLLRSQRENVVVKYIRKYYASENLRRTIAVAIASGLVACLGRFVFGVEAKAMFLAWFAVVFAGSVISTTFSDKSQKK